MAVTSGFYNSVNGDRRYSTIQIAEIFDGLIGDGVYASIEDALMVRASSGLTLIVGSGRSWFNHSWTKNDADLPVILDPADVVLNRIDAIVNEVNSTESVRCNSIKVVKGTPSSYPTRPSLTNSDGVYQYPLAYIAVNANVTEITQSDITNMVGTSECPFVTGILETISTDELVVQWQVQFEALIDQLHKDIAAAKDSSIYALKEDAVTMTAASVTLSASGWADNAQTVNVTGVTADDEKCAVITTAAAASLETYLDCGIVCSAQEDGTLTFTCSDTPTADVTVNVLILQKGG